MKWQTRAAIVIGSIAVFAPNAAWADKPTPPPPLACTAALTMVAFPGYVDCRGAFSGNINGAAGELTALAGYWGGAWLWAGKSDDASSGPFTSSPTAGPTGTIGFDTPIKGGFVIGIKQCDFYSWYLYNEASPISSIAIDSRGTCSNAGFSHVALYTGDGVGTPQSVVPEPATMTLFATGMIGIAGAAVRRRRKLA